MKRKAILALILGCMLATGNLVAQTAADKEQARPDGKPAAEQQTQPKQPRPGKSAKPATTFRPSERIKADSSVAFPVDI